MFFIPKQTKKENNYEKIIKINDLKSQLMPDNINLNINDDNKIKNNNNNYNSDDNYNINENYMMGNNINKDNKLNKYISKNFIEKIREKERYNELIKEIERYNHIKNNENDTSFLYSYILTDIKLNY